MTAAVPVLRDLTVADVDAVVDLANLCEIAETGEIDPELVDWIKGEASVGRFCGVGIDDDVGLAAFGYIECVAEHQGLEAEVRVRPGLPLDLGLPVLAAVRRIAAEFAPTKPVQMFANSSATAHRNWLQAQGAREIRHFWRMAIDFDDAPPAVPDPPAGLDVRRAHDDESDLRAIFAVADTSFADHFGHSEERTYEGWIETWRSRRGFDPHLWWVVEDAERAVAVLLGMTFTGDDGVTIGHVGTLGTLKECRGRGIGTYLLRAAFRDFHERGCRRVTLGVDSENGTGAVRLYESVGMRAVNDWPLYEFPPLSSYGPAGSMRSDSNAT